MRLAPVAVNQSALMDDVILKSAAMRALRGRTPFSNSRFLPYDLRAGRDRDSRDVAARPGKTLDEPKANRFLGPRAPAGSLGHGHPVPLTPTLAFAPSTSPFRAHRRGSRGRPDCLDAGRLRGGGLNRSYALGKTSGTLCCRDAH